MLSYTPLLQFCDENGNPLSSGTLTVYYAGTTSLATLYSDTSVVTSITNPITLDSTGIAQFFVPYNEAYDIVVKDSTGKPIYSDSLLGNYDPSVSATDPTIVGSIRYISIAGSTLTSAHVTSPPSTDLTIAPGANAVTSISAYFVDIDGYFNANGYNIKGAADDAIRIYYSAGASNSAISNYGNSNFLTKRVQFINPSYSATTAYMTVTNAATGNSPTITFTSSAATKNLFIAQSKDDNFQTGIKISGVSYKRPSAVGATNGQYLKSNGDGTTVWGA